MNRTNIATVIAATLVLTVMLFNPTSKAQDPVIRIEGSATIQDRNRVECTREFFWYTGAGVDIQFSAALNAEMRPPLAKGGSWTIRSIVRATKTRPATLSSYIFDGKFVSATEQTFSASTRSFTLVGTANYQGFCRQGTPPPVQNPSPSTPVTIRIQGQCTESGNTDLNVEVSDAAGLFARGFFPSAKVRCESGGYLNDSLDRH